MGDFIVPVVFLALIAGMVTLGVGLNIVMKWANSRLSGTGDMAERLAAMEERVGELEERVDFAERALTEARSPRQLESRGDR